MTESSHFKRTFCLPHGMLCQTSRKKNIPALGKLIQIRIQQRDSFIAMRNNQRRPEDVRQKLKDSLIINVQNLQSNSLSAYGKLVYSCRVNDKIISHSEPKQKQTSLEKCRLNTEIFDQLKKDVVRKIKIKRAQTRENKFRISTQANKENLLEHSLRSHGRSSSDTYTCEDWSKKFQPSSCERYMDISVADFLEEDEIGENVIKRFEEYRSDMSSRNRPRAQTE